MSAVAVTVREGGVRFRVHVQPRASRSEVVGVREGALRVRLQAPPVDGAANEALVELLAERLSVSRRDVRIVAGVAGRSKVVDVNGIAPARVARLAE